MVKLNSEQLNHLQNLANIKINDSEKEIFLEKLDPIISKLDELSQIDISNFKQGFSTDNILRVLDGPSDFQNKKSIMDNVEHEKINNSIVIKSVLN